MFRRIECTVNRIPIHGVQGELFTFQVVPGDFHGFIGFDLIWNVLVTEQGRPTTRCSRLPSSRLIKEK